MALANTSRAIGAVTRTLRERLTSLVGSAADSPIVETADRLEFRLGASRAVDWRFK